MDNHTDVVDTEIIAMRLSGGGVSMIAGAGLGANALAASLGAVAEQPGNAAAADSFFDVFVEVSGGGLGGPAYNQTPINVATVIDCLPPKGRYIHIQGCTPIFDSPVPGVGTQVGNLVSARHFTFPECCLPDGTCTAMATKLCQAAGGTPVPRCLGDANGNMIDDACEAPPPPDPHRTVQGNSLTFGTPDIPGLPADFFGPGSDPLTGVTVNMQGGPNDTLIQRDGPIFCPGAGFPRPCDPVSVEIVQLDLVSVAPITVTFNGGASTEDWDLAVSLSGLPSSPNLLTATKTHANGGIYDSTIPVLPRLTFTKVSNPADVRVLDYGVELIPELRINFTNVPWVVNLDPGLVGTISAPSNGNFVPSILEQTPGDTATQIVVQATGQSKGGGVTHPVRPRPTVCPLPGGANDPCAPFQVRDCQGSASDLCLPDVIVVTGTCLAAPQLPCTADNQCPANVCVKTSTVAACACATDADCRVEFDPVNNAPFCVGTCPPGEICELFTTPVTLPDGTVTEGFFCDCVT
ncbi:MAG: hypothetical protein ACE5EX_12425, partial [Phycisphaerae bacterium]